MCLGPSFATRASVLSTNCAELSNVSFLPGDKGNWLLANLESQRECRRSVSPCPHFFVQGKDTYSSSALHILSSQNSLFLLWVHGNTIIAGLSKYPLLGIFVVNNMKVK